MPCHFRNGHTKPFMNGNLVEGYTPISMTIYSAKLTMLEDRGLELVPPKYNFSLEKTTNRRYDFRKKINVYFTLRKTGSLHMYAIQSTEV